MLLVGFFSFGERSSWHKQGTTDFLSRVAPSPLSFDSPAPTFAHNFTPCRHFGLAPRLLFRNVFLVLGFFRRPPLRSCSLTPRLRGSFFFWDGANCPFLLDLNVALCFGHAPSFPIFPSVPPPSPVSLADLHLRPDVTKSGLFPPLNRPLPRAVTQTLDFPYFVAS